MSTLRDKKPGWADHASIDRIAAYYALDTNAPFPQPFWELLLNLAVAYIPVAIVVWGPQTATKAELKNADAKTTRNVKILTYKSPLIFVARFMHARLKS